MKPQPIALHRFSPERPPAVVLGDLTLIRPLGMAAIPVIAATEDRSDSVMSSRHVSSTCLLPGFDEAHQDESTEILLRLGERLHGTLGRKIPLFYGKDPQLELIYRHQRALSEHYLFVLNEEDVRWSLLDKARFHHLCEAKRILAPRTLPIGGDIAEGLVRLREPILVKPRRKTDWGEIQRDLFGGTGKARVFETRADLIAHPHFLRLKEALVIQEHIPCSVGDLVSFHGFAGERGELLAWFCGRKIRTYPAFAGESALVEVTDDAAVCTAGREIAEKLGLKGPFKIDLVRDARSGELYTLEVNARYTLWNYVGAAAGVNLPVIAYDYLVGGRLPPAPPRAVAGYRWLDLYRDYRALRDDGGVTPLAWLGSILRSRTLVDTFVWNDPKPFARWAGTLLFRKAARHALRGHRGHPR